MDLKSIFALFFVSYRRKMTNQRGKKSNIEMRELIKKKDSDIKRDFESGVKKNERESEREMSNKSYQKRKSARGVINPPEDQIILLNTKQRYF